MNVNIIIEVHPNVAPYYASGPILQGNTTFLGTVSTLLITSHGIYA